MIISHVTLKNWRNFLKAEAALGDVNYIIGANASGKSNFLDVFRFLQDVAKAEGGGLQKAFADRGGLSKVRCLHARSKPEVTIEIVVSDKAGEPTPLWKYVLAVKSEGVGHQRPVIAREEVYRYVGATFECILRRPDKDDMEDRERLTQTSLEQIQSNKQFRALADLLSGTTYLHLVPQFIKYGDLIGGRRLDRDPFGQAFMDRIAATPEKFRTVRLNRIQKALAQAIPQFEEIRYVQDAMGRPHLEARYTHYRPNGGLQREDQFSDGTLRLIALFWLLLDGDTMLLLEEPELSLDEKIVAQFPRMIDLLHRFRKKTRRQIIITTHSRAFLDNPAINADFVLRLEAGKEGTEIFGPSAEDAVLIKSGFTAADVMLSKVHPKHVDQMVLL